MSNLERKEDRKYCIDEVLKHAIYTKLKKAVRKNFDGDMVKVNSKRLMCFKKSGIKCVACGIEGEYFYKERTGYKDKSKNRGPFHFNLYGMKEGEEILMTKDHVFPKSKGGPDTSNNLQTMCAPCNTEKGCHTRQETI